MHREESSNPCCCHLLNRTEPPGPLWATANVRTSVVSSKDTQRLSLHISFSQLLKGRTEVLGLVVMMALELLGQRGELLLSEFTAPLVVHLDLFPLPSALLSRLLWLLFLLVCQKVFSSVVLRLAQIFFCE